VNRQRSYWLLRVFGLTLFACPASRSAIQVTVEVAPTVRSTCFRVVAQSEGGPEVLSEPIARKDRLVVAVYSSDQLSGAVTLTARGFVGKGCEEPQRLNDESAPAQQAFTKDEVAKVTLTVGPPSSTVDADADGFRAVTKGGPDCSDSNAAINPAAAELCQDRIDNDCDTLADCASPRCESFGCDDQNRCTTQDRCTNGSCVGMPVQCMASSGQCGPVGACNPATGTCAFTSVDAGTSCDDGNPCSGPDVCLTDGGCGATTEACTTPPGPCFVSQGVCGGAAGCTYAPLDAGTVCSDGNPCTTNDSCDSTGVCTGATITCASSPGQCFAAMGLCNPIDGGCSYQVNTGTDCNDGVSCTKDDTCRVDGRCAGTAFSCTSPPSACSSSPGACLLDGGCQYPDLPVGSTCDDGNRCTTNDRCSATQSCDAVAVSCDVPPGPCFGNGSCNVDAGCQYSPTPGATCSDGNVCTTSESCLNDGGCGGGTPLACSTPPSSCFGASGTCVSGVGCTYPVGPLYQPCAGGACRADGSCAAPTFPFTPSNFSPATVAAAGPVGLVTLNCAAVFDSTPGASAPFVSWCGQPQPPLVTVTQAGGPDVVVLGMYGLDLPSGSSLRVQGSRPVIFAVFDSATIAGQLFSNAGDTPGAGGSLGSCAGSTGGTGSVSNGRGGGGGGGGFATAGASGGRGDNATSTSGTAGTAFGAANLIPLRGGCSGGNGGGASAFGARGAGGGALQFSVASSLRVSGTVSVSGGGGRPGTSNSSGGGGGGSGGSILLEAKQMTVTSTARLTSNGGAGGEGADGVNNGGSGENGSTTTNNPAQGGSISSGGNGGNGGAGSTGPTVGRDDSRGGGGGGGAVGRIRLNGFGMCTIDGAAVVSPSASRSGCP
jgi:hypothetical protein